MSAHAVAINLDRALRNGFLNIDDPGDAGTFNWSNKGKVYCAVVTVGGAQTRVTPDADAYGVGTELCVYLKTDGGDCTITYDGGTTVLDDEGDAVIYVVVDTAAGHVWTPMQTLQASGVTAASAYGTDDVLVASDGTGRGTKATAIDKDNVVTAASAFVTTHLILQSEGTGKGVSASAIPVANLVTIEAFLERVTVSNIPLSDAKTWDNRAVNIPLTPATDDLGLVTGTFLTDAHKLSSASAAADVTRKAGFAVKVPNDYSAGAAIALVAAWTRLGIADVTMTLDAEVVRMAAPTVDIQTIAAASVNGAASGTTTFTLTPTNVVPGEVLNIVMTIAVDTTGTSAGATIDRLSLNYTPIAVV
jgi:hypothetical protein